MSLEKESLQEDVAVLAGTIGERNVYQYSKLRAAAAYIERRLMEAGLVPQRQEYEAEGKVFANLEAEIPGEISPREVVVVGAHYDTEKGSPGANDNASGVAALLALGHAFAGQPLARTLRLVAFTNEERPFLRTEKMGSRVYARACRDRADAIAGMLCLETIGYRSDHPRSQRLSLFGRLLPRKGDFLELVSNRASQPLLQRARQAFERPRTVPVDTTVLPGHFPGARSSDQWSFWQEGFPAIMATDTAPLRYPYYHRAEDTPDKIQWDFLLGVVQGLKSAVSDLAVLRK